MPMLNRGSAVAPGEGSKAAPVQYQVLCALATDGELLRGGRAR